MHDRLARAGRRRERHVDATESRKPGNASSRVDPRYFRPTEVETLLGDPTKAREKLGWTPKTTFEELVREMVARTSKLARARRTGQRRTAINAASSRVTAMSNGIESGRIFVAGHRGLVGSAIVRRLQAAGCDESARCARAANST